MPSIKITSTEPARIEPGIHSARIEHAVEAVSKNGNEMLKLEVKIGPLTLNDWVTFAESNQKNVVNFANSIGIKTDVDELTIEPPDIIGRTGRVVIGPSDRISPKTNLPYLEIKSWVRRDVKTATTATDLQDDTIPF
jgi:hypothetical protein